jgi:hypothetical protein
MSVSEILILIARGRGSSAVTSRTTYVFEIAKNSFCPSGGTLADRAVTSLRFSSIWLRTLLFSCNTTISHYTLNIAGFA